MNELEKFVVGLVLREIMKISDEDHGSEVFQKFPHDYVLFQGHSL